MFRESHYEVLVLISESNHKGFAVDRCGILQLNDNGTDNVPCTWTFGGNYRM